MAGKLKYQSVVRKTGKVGIDIDEDDAAIVGGIIKVFLPC